MTQRKSTKDYQENSNAWPMARELTQEHGVLLRQIGGLQHRCTELLRSTASRVMSLEGENLRLRAELVLFRTGVCWGLGTAVLLRPARSKAASSRTSVEADTREAQDVICQTGCVGHAHPWLEMDGQCRRSGLACDRVSEEADAHRS